jgi:hypothetical protein
VKQEKEEAIMPPDLDPKEAFRLALEASMAEEDQKWDGLQEALRASAMAAQAQPEQLPPPLPPQAAWAGQPVPPAPPQDAWQQHQQPAAYLPPVPWSPPPFIDLSQDDDE